MIKVLIVEDSRMSRMLIRAIIESVYPHAEIIEATTAEEAEEYIISDAATLDIATVDLNLPGGMDGIELAALLRQRFPQVRIGILTASIEEHILLASAQLGATFIPKPIKVESLSAFLRADEAK
jgi:two-component system, chemotaxis family, chemotaxis protein CheY